VAQWDQLGDSGFSLTEKEADRIPRSRGLDVSLRVERSLGAS